MQPKIIIAENPPPIKKRRGENHHVVPVFFFPVRTKSSGEETFSVKEIVQGRKKTCTCLPTVATGWGPNHTSGVSIRELQGVMLFDGATHSTCTYTQSLVLKSVASAGVRTWIRSPFIGTNDTSRLFTIHEVRVDVYPPRPPPAVASPVRVSSSQYPTRGSLWVKPPPRSSLNLCGLTKRHWTCRRGVLKFWRANLRTSFFSGELGRRSERPLAPEEGEARPITCCGAGKGEAQSSWAYLATGRLIAARDSLARPGKTGRGGPLKGESPPPGLISSEISMP